MELVSSNLELEFNSENRAKLVMGSSQPDKVNFVLSLGPLQTNNLSVTHTFQEGIAVGFYNQITIYGVHNGEQMSMLKEIVVSEVAEDLVCACLCRGEGLLAFGGALAVGYVYSLCGPKIS
mmetsp:Transcript_24424/g.32726  ORF Transcript_24424/g.32726 Transcript_24424/m.32726 type:complete len:121 (+) Transcript_24424:81-443(+)